MSIKIQTREESGVKWVSVDDMLPSDYELVLIEYGGDLFFGHLVGGEGGDWRFLNSQSFYLCQEPVEKWCHIPE